MTLKSYSDLLATRIYSKCFKVCLPIMACFRSWCPWRDFCHWILAVQLTIQDLSLSVKKTTFRIINILAVHYLVEYVVQRVNKAKDNIYLIPPVTDQHGIDCTFCRVNRPCSRMRLPFCKSFEWENEKHGSKKNCADLMVPKLYLVICGGSRSGGGVGGGSGGG